MKGIEADSFEVRITNGSEMPIRFLRELIGQRFDADFIFDDEAMLWKDLRWR